MRASEALNLIHRPWLMRVSYHFARGEELRETFVQLLEQLFNVLVQAVETGDPSWLDPVLDEWVQARTESELEMRELSLDSILGQIHLTSYAVARENLEPADALTLEGALLPVFLHAFRYVSRVEMARNIDHISKELENANNNLQRLDKNKSDFIAIAAHELKTPLTLIEGYASMLREQLPAKGADDSAKLLLKGIDNGTRRLKEIVDDMIDVSLIDNNLLELNFQPVWIKRLVEVLEHEFEAIVAERRQVVEIHAFEGWDEMTFGDGERLYQAFRNLVSNAIKYTPDGGKIQIGGRKLPGFLEVTITDSGIGIDPDNHLLIFEKFGRLGNASLHSSGKTKFKGGGPGLGLSITKGILEAHGGTVWVESEGYDEVCCPGSTFHVLLPLVKQPPDDRTARLFAALIQD
jgi:signal transduction histidine kinase